MFLVFWLGLTLVGLETYSRLSEQWSEQKNTYITGQKPVFLPMPTGLPIVLDNFRWPLRLPRSLPQGGQSPLVDSSGGSWPQCFDSLAPMQRHLAAGSHDQMVLEYDKTGNLVETWGFPLETEFFRRGGQGVTGWFCNCALLSTGFSHGVSEALCGEGSSRQIGIPFIGTLFEARFQPSPETAGAFAFVPSREGLTKLMFTLPPDSPWDIYQYRYKKSIPNMRWGVRGTCFLNNVGFRGKDIAVPKPHGLYRILCLGGSTTEEGLSDDTTYPALLEKKLAAAFPSNRIEVVNCGVSGMRASSHLMRFADYLALEPDLFVCYEGVNDAAGELPFSWLAFDSSLLVKAAAFSHFVRKRCDTLLYGTEKKLQEDVQTFTLGRFRLMRQWALAYGADDMVFCSIAAPPYEELPDQEREYIRYASNDCSPLITPNTYLKIIGTINAGLKGLSEGEGWGYIPVAENFHFGLGCFGDICHMYGWGTERKAEIIFQCLRQRLPILLNRSR